VKITETACAISNFIISGHLNFCPNFWVPGASVPGGERGAEGGGVNVLKITEKACENFKFHHKWSPKAKFLGPEHVFSKSLKFHVLWVRVR
jgi:hypothetical protein